MEFFIGKWFGLIIRVKMFVKVLRLIFTEVLLLTFFKFELVDKVIVLGNVSEMLRFYVLSNVIKK